MSDEIDQLYKLGRLCGVEDSYQDVHGHTIRPAPEILCSVLQSLDVEIEGLADVPGALRAQALEQARRVVEPVGVVWDRRPLNVDIQVPIADERGTVRCELMLEDGGSRAWEQSLADLSSTAVFTVEGIRFTRKRIRLTPGLPLGYHQLRIEIAGHQHRVLIISAPTETYQGQRGSGMDRGWGVFAPVYSLHSKRSWGAGDLTDLESLVDFVGGLGGQVVGTLPLLAGSFRRNQTPSPYSPVSRMFWNEFFLDVERLPEFQRCSQAQAMVVSPDFLKERESLRTMPLCDYHRQMALKRRVIEEIAAMFFAQPDAGKNDFQQFLRQYPQVEDYARFCAVTETRGESWHEWPRRMREGELSDTDCETRRMRYHLYVQWRMHEQLQAVAARARDHGPGLYLDLPLGVDPDGYDVWRERDSFATGVAAGAPPDAFFSAGQNWGCPPMHPRSMRDHGHHYLIACLRHHLDPAGVLRIDHVMGLHRVFWIPDGAAAADGVYVCQPNEELYAIVSLESHRHQSVIVGEDLGTVPDTVREAMKRHRVRRMYVLQYGIDPQAREALAEVIPDSVAALNTHDTPTFAGFWTGRDIEDRHSLDLIDTERVKEETGLRQEQKAALCDALAVRGYLDGGPEPMAVYRACLRYLGDSRSSLTLVNLEDLWLEPLPQNVPGTRDERPNWRRRADYPLEVFREMPDVVEPLRELNRNRRKGQRMVPKSSASKRKSSAAGRSPSPVRYDATLLSSDDLYLFNEGTHIRLYEHLGSHLRTVEGVKGVSFAVWAPDAERVTVIGDFNGWNRDAHPLRPRDSSGIWEGFIRGIGQGANYKYCVTSRYGAYQVEKADPLARHYETPPRTASIVWDTGYTWGDADWMTRRREHNAIGAPMAIYEVHLGSWMRVPDEGNRFLSYREIAPRLAEYVRRMGFTHVELLPIMEHPFYGSWGYQTTGYFAPTSRYGTPQDFKYLVDHLHREGIGVILDWVPSHFPADEHALGFFDGTHLFEHADQRLGLHPDWDSCIFNYGRNEVRSFLLSSALFWLDQYHADGLRVDAVASMLYLDYSRKDGEWIPNQYGGRENLDALVFLRQLNTEVYRCHPDVQMFAEESTDWPMVSRPTHIGGLGFGFKWDMGWMHDTLTYMTKDPVHRAYHHNDLTFRMLYAFSENFTLPLSHDEVVHGKSSLLSKMPGDDWQKFANLRLLYGYMYAQSGKKLLFMGGEIGQRGEWDHESSVEWHLLQYGPHSGCQKWVEDLNRLYRSEPALHELDTEPAGFEWVDCSDALQSVVGLIRWGRDGRTGVLAVANFTPVPRHGYRIGVPKAGYWTELLNSDADLYGGSGIGNNGGLESEPVGSHGRDHSLSLTLPPLGIVFLRSPA